MLKMCFVRPIKIAHCSCFDVSRPPSSAMAVFEELRAYLDTHIQLGDSIILTGDFNLSDVEWKKFSLKNRSD